MASTITLTCPECEKKLKASSDLLGKKIRCKSCGAVFPAREEKQGGAPAKAGGKGADAQLEADNVPYILKEEYTGRRCPYCANAMEEEDRICLHCGYDTLTREHSRMKKVRETTGMDVTKWLIPGIACAILTLAMLGGCAFYWFGVNRDTFGGEEVWYSWFGTLFPKVYTTVAVLFASWYAGRFAVRRLYNYMPPEIEEKVAGG